LLLTVFTISAGHLGFRLLLMLYQTSITANTIYNMPGTIFRTTGFENNAWPKYHDNVARIKYTTNRVKRKRERSITILFTPAEPAIRYGNITIPHVTRQAEPLLNPSIKESVIR
jgi:hypothetical protein